MAAVINLNHPTAGRFGCWMEQNGSSFVLGMLEGIIILDLNLTFRVRVCGAGR